MKKLAILALAFAAGCGDHKPAQSDPVRPSAEAQRFIGTVHGGDLPAGIERKGFTVLDSIHGHDYALTATQQGHRKMLWLDRDTSLTSGRVWKVVAVLGFDSIPRGYEVGIGSCTSGSIPTSEIVALIHRDGPKAAAEVRRAWRVNRANQSFDDVRTAGIVCP